MTKRRLVIVGNGMAGARFVEELVQRGGRDRFDVTIFGEEPHGNYNRILLSGILAGSHQANDIFINPLPWYEQNGVTLRAGCKIDGINLERRFVRSLRGDDEPYDVLVLATGSSGVVPPIEGVHTVTGVLKDGVFVFRTLDDCHRILQRAQTATRAVVIGGGLLGLEAAKGLANRGLEVHVLHLMPHVMETQLDAAAGAVLLRELQQVGLRVHLNTTADAVLGDARVTGVTLRDGTRLPCDLVVVAAGIRPNVDVARRSGLSVQRGIVVADDLSCRPYEDVYAIGECAEHRGRVYGLVAPVWEQAVILAGRLTGRSPNTQYVGSRTSTKLKVAGVDVAVMGDRDPIEEDDEVVSYAEPSRGIYKKLILRGNRLAGAIVLGDGAIVPGLLEAFREGRAVSDTRAHLLFPAIASNDTSAPHSDRIPETAQICDCNAVTKAHIVEAILAGARTVQAVSDATRACTGCGTCKPQVQLIVEQTCRTLTPVEVDASGAGDVAPRVPTAGSLVVTLNKIERLKQEKDGLDILGDVPRLARSPWDAIEEGDRERLKWAGVFFRRQTPGHFMMRVRISNGITNAAQIRVLAGISRDMGLGFADITTRQQIQLRGFGIEHVPAIWEQLESVNLASLQTGMDNIRNVNGCPLAGLMPSELFDASPIVREFTDMFLRNKEFTNLPRKFNAVITGCTEQCTPGESQDLALLPAIADNDGRQILGFNVMAGGKMGSGGFQAAKALNVFVPTQEAAALCAAITLLFRDHGSRAARNRARLAFLLDEWGVPKFRRELEARVGHPLAPAATDARGSKQSDHLGIVKQKQPGLNAVGLAVPVGRITADQLFELARITEEYGSGDVRITTGQNVIVPNVSNARVAAMLKEPLLVELPYDPHGAIRGLVSCTGIDYCHFALIETKELALKTASYLQDRLPQPTAFTTHWSGCPAGCGNHALADVGLLGKNIRIDGQLVDAVDVYIGGRTGAHARPGTKVLEDVPCDDLPAVLERMIPYVTKKKLPGVHTKSVSRTSAAPPEPRDATANV